MGFDFFKPKINLSRFDWLLFGAVILLISIGLVIQYSLDLGLNDFSSFKKQLIFSIIGILIFWGLTVTNYRRFKEYAYYIYGLALVLLILSLIFGKVIRGTQGWLLGFQVAEFAKFALVIMLARFWADNLEKYPRTKKVILGSLLAVLSIVLVLLQPDFGSAFILIAITFFSITMIDRSWKNVIKIVVVSAIVLVVAWMFVFKDYQKERVLNFVDPQRDPMGSGYQVTQSIIAVGSGEFLGRGFGLGSQSQLKFLPEARTDFVFSVVAEELGFVFSFITIFLYGVIFWRLTTICLRVYDDFSLLLVFGVGSFLISQVMINIGMNLGLAPITGITLPLLSYGGSSLIISLMFFGLVESVQRHQVQRTNLD
ncbi:MAG: FtsW/RodA/SpoVE family cell cycle protein [Patescibacteria group bacterium]